MPDAWAGVAAQRKTLMVWPEWPEPEPQTPAKKASTQRDELRSAAAETLSLVIPLGDEGGVGLEGVRLRIVVWAYKALREVTATLEVEGGRSFVTIARLDGWPIDPHMNVMARGRRSVKHVPMEVVGHHVHRFSDNAKLGLPAFAPDANLPIAVPIPNGLGSFRDFLRTLAVEFNIDGVDQIQPPDWRVML